jgi:hypothetical protein
MDQPVGREMELKDVEAGAYFKLTPSIRVGGAVALGDNNPPWPPARPRSRNPRRAFAWKPPSSSRLRLNL